MYLSRLVPGAEYCIMSKKQMSDLVRRNMRYCLPFLIGFLMPSSENKWYRP